MVTKEVMLNNSGNEKSEKTGNPSGEGTLIYWVFVGNEKEPSTLI